MRLETGQYESPIGPLGIIECAEGPLAVEFGGRLPQLRWAIRARGPAPTVEVVEGPCRWTRQWLDTYFEGRPGLFPFPRHLARWLEVSAAQLQVFRALRRIPFGQTRSYADLAAVTGIHPRAVGQLVGSNHLAILIPCHRVVGHRGDLVGYGGGIPKKRWLLTHEVRHTRLHLR